MTAVQSRINPATLLAASQPIRARFRITWLLLPVSMILWAVGVARTNATQLGPYGLLPALPIVFYLGLGLLVLSASIEIARARLSRLTMALHSVALVIMLYGTAPLVYPEGRYAWLYKTIGIVQYVNPHGRLNGSIDIYQNWPGFLALAAWFDKVAGVASPLAYAKWAQLIFELAALPLLYLAYEALSLPSRQRWIAILLYSASNLIGQDYFSPQALGTVLSLGVIAFVLRWMYAANGSLLPGGTKKPVGEGEAEVGTTASTRRLAPLLAVLMVVFFVLTFTHELSPYLVAAQLCALAVAGLVRPRWLPFVLLAISFAYLLPHLGYVNAHYGLLSSLGDLLRNMTPPTLAGGGPQPSSQVLIERCAEALILGIWAFSLVGAWVRRRSRRTVLTLLILSCSPVLVLTVVPYGNEGILRVYLFSLPWAAALAAAVLAPLPSIARKHARPVHAAVALDRDVQQVAKSRIALRPAFALAVALVLFLVAFFGDDASNVMSVSEVDAVTAFLSTAKPGPVFVPIDNAAPTSDARYNLFPVAQIFGSLGALRTPQVRPDVASILARIADSYTGRHGPAYVLITSSMVAYNQAYPTAAPDGFSILRASLNRSPDWYNIFDWKGTVIYEMPPDAPNPGPGPSGIAGFSVP
jgi:hypothetical protein